MAERLADASCAGDGEYWNCHQHGLQTEREILALQTLVRVLEPVLLTRVSGWTVAREALYDLAQAYRQHPDFDPHWIPRQPVHSTP